MLLWEMPPDVIIKSNLDKFLLIVFFVCFKSSLIMPRSKASHPTFLVRDRSTILFASLITNLLFDSLVFISSPEEKIPTLIFL